MESTHNALWGSIGAFIDKAKKSSSPAAENFSHSLTMPDDMSNDFSWEGNNYSTGQQIDASNWDTRQIKDFRDASGAKYRSDDVTKQFDQWSLDNLDGISQYEFQLNGTGDQWADMTTSPEMNRFWQGYGINEGDREAAMDFYNYYDGTEYDDAGSVTREGDGINKLSEINPYGSYTDMENVTGASANARSAFNRGYLEDMESLGDGSFELDGKKTQDVSDEDLAKLNYQSFLATTADADARGATEDRETDGAVREDPKRIYDSLQSDYEFITPPGTLQDYEPSFMHRELGKYYGEPTIDPDIRPRDMWSIEEMNKLAADAGFINEYDIEGGAQDGQRTADWQIMEPTRGTEEFRYTEGSLDDPYSDDSMNREAFDSAMSLMGPGLASGAIIEQNDDGSFKQFVDASWNDQAPQSEEDIDWSQPNLSYGGVDYNILGEDGKPIPQEGVFGLSKLAAPSAIYRDEFINEQIKDGGLYDGSVLPGWSDTSDLVDENGWTAEDYRVYAGYADRAQENQYGPSREFQQQQAVQFTNAEKAQRENVPTAPVEPTWRGPEVTDREDGVYPLMRNYAQMRQERQ